MGSTRPIRTAVATRRRQRQAAAGFTSPHFAIMNAVEVGPRAREPLAERRGVDLENPGGLRSVELQDLTENVRQPVVAIQTEQHPVRAPELDLLEEEALVDRGLTDARGVGQALIELPAEPLEGEVLRLDPGPARRREVVAGDSVHPRQDRAVATEGAEVGDDADQDLLRRVPRVLRVPEHPEGEAVDAVLDPADQLVEREGVPLPCARDQRPERRVVAEVRHGYRVSRRARSVASSSRRIRDCAASVPSSSARGTGGGRSTKL